MKRSYTFKEIAALLTVHNRTVQSWNGAGLKTLEGTKSPYLVMGAQLKSFLRERSNKDKIKLSKNEFYCFKCRNAVTPTKFTSQPNGIVGNNKQSLRLEGNCPKCNGLINKFSSK